MSKRSRENETKDVSNKKQMSLLSMFKPVAAPTKPVTTAKLTDQADVSDQSVSVTSTTISKKPRDLFKNVDEETLALLDLEIRTMNYEWLKVLAPELLKPYFLKVKS